MTIEEKAKAYDEALERARKLYNSEETSADVEIACETIFPAELAESEDEKVKRILHSISSKISFHLHDIFTEEEFQCFDAWSNVWLKKQGKSKWTDEDECPKWFKPQGKTALEAVKEISPAESLGISPEKYEEIVNECIYGESVDKVVPKFNVGDWVVFIASENVYQVEKIENYEYTLRHTLGGSMPLPFSSEELIRPWTIKDVKPGDVLVGKVDGDNYILIFKQIKDGWIETYGHYYDAVNRFCIPSQLFCRDYKGTFYPATKEQRDTLFTKMKEEGYEWDENKKELRKIEQKSKWSNEDEERLQSCIIALQGKGLMGGVDTMDSKWLKSLKQRIHVSSAKTCKNDTLLDLLNKMPSCITVDGIFYHFMLRKTALAYTAYYAGEEEGSGKVIFAMTAFSPIDLLTEMLEKLKEEGLLK